MSSDPQQAASSPSTGVEKPTEAVTGVTGTEDVVVQYLVVRSDLKKWNLGALITQVRFTKDHARLFGVCVVDTYGGCLFEQGLSRLCCCYMGE